MVALIPAAQEAAGPPASADIRRQGDTLIVAPTGEWKLEYAAPRFVDLAEAALAADAQVSRKLRAIAFDTTALGPWDSSLLIFLLQGQDYCEAHHLQFVASGLPERIARLLALARAVPERIVTGGDEPRISRVAPLSTCQNRSKIRR